MLSITDILVDNMRSLHQSFIICAVFSSIYVFSKHQLVIAAYVLTIKVMLG